MSRRMAQRRLYGYDKTPLHFIASLFPLFTVLSQYKWTYIYKDFISGCVVSMIHLPQAFAGAMTAVMRPMHGIYMVMIPGLVYAFLGTSPQNSVGGMPITAALTGVSAARIREFHHPANYTLATAGQLMDLQFAIGGAIALVAGIFQILMGLTKLGFLSHLLSSNVIDPFSVACCMQAIFGQVPSMFGLSLYPYCGLAKHPWLLSSFFTEIQKVNPYETAISALAGSCILGFREFVQPILYKKTKLVYPVEFFVMMIAGAACYFWDLNKQHGVRVVGPTPDSLPWPKVPSMEYLPFVLGEGFINALVSFGLTISSAKILARKEGDKIHPSQELIAVGSSNVVGSCFSCWLAAAPIGRSIINQSMGSRSQLSSIFGSLFMIVLFLSVGQSLNYLPTCIVSTNIVVTLIMTLKIFGDLPKIWRGSPLDAVVWLTTFCSCIFLDVRVGFIIGVVMSLFTVTYRSQKPKVRVLGRMPHSSGYLPLKYYKTAQEIPGIKILQIQSALHFGNAEYLVKQVKALAFETSVAPPNLPVVIVDEESDPKDSSDRHRTSLHASVRRSADIWNSFMQPLHMIPKGRAPVVRSTPNLRTAPYDDDEEVTHVSEAKIWLSNNTQADDDDDYIDEATEMSTVDDIISRVIIDLTMGSFIDSVGLRALEQMASDFEKLSIEVLLAQNRGSITHQIRKLNILKTIPPKNIFLCVEDAVKAAMKRNRRMILPKNTILDERADKRFWPTPMEPVEGLPGTN